MLAQHTDESFRADHVRFRNAGGAVVQVLMRSDFFATEAFFCDHGRHPFLEQRRGPGGLRVVAPRIMSSGTPHCSAIESNTAPSGSCKSLIDRLLNAANKHGEAAKGLEGRVSGTDATTRPGNRRDGQLQVRAAGDLRWPL